MKRIAGGRALLAKLSFLFSIASLPFVASCGGGYSAPPVPTPTVASITVSPTSASIAASATQQFTATAKDSYGTTLSGVTFTWSSSATSVATIDSTGLAKGVTAGTTQITAASGGVTSAPATLTVFIPVASITVSPTSASIGTNATQQFTATAKDSSGATLSGVTFAWSSSATSVATIDSTGLAKGVTAGTTQITATAGLVTSVAATLTVVNPTTVSGTAATGNPIVGAAVTLKDTLGHSRTATTGPDGSFTVDTTGLTPPFLVKVQPAVTTNPPLYSVSADANATATINVHPLTDLIIRSWYGTQQLAIDAAFGSPTGPYTPPPPIEVKLIGNVMVQMTQLWLTKNGIDTTKFDLIATPFQANGIGLDKVLNQTTVNTSTGLVKITDGTTTQNSTITYPTVGTITVKTTTTSPAGTTVSTVAAVVPTQSAQQNALNAIQAQMNAFAQTVNSKGSALTASDIMPFLAPDLLDGGQNQSTFAAQAVTLFRGSTVSLTVLRINSLDATSGVADAVFTLTQTLGSQSATQTQAFQFKNEVGNWLLFGDQRIAKLSLQAEMRTNQGAYTLNSGPDINVDVQPPQGKVTNVTLSGGGFWVNAPTQRGPTRVETFAPTPTTTLTVLYDTFFLNSGPLTTLVPAGTSFMLTLTPNSGSPVTYTVPSNTFTTDPISFIGLTSSALAAIRFNQPMTFSWTLPSTYAVAALHLNALVFTGDQTLPSTFQCKLSNPSVLANTTTSGTVTIPSTCNGLAVTQVNMNLSATGPNGERSQAIYFFK